MQYLSVLNEASNFPSDNVRHEERVWSSIAHKNPQEERLKGNNNYKKKRPTATKELNAPRQQRPSTAKDARQPTRLHRSKQESNDTTDFSILTVRGTYFASKHVAFGLGLGLGSGGQRLLYACGISFCSHFF